MRVSFGHKEGQPSPTARKEVRVGVWLLVTGQLWVSGVRRWRESDLIVLLCFCGGDVIC